MSAQQPIDPHRWEPAIQKFEAEDKQTPPVKGGIVFIGASSIVRWTNLAESFPGLKVVNRGFGGSELAESVKYASRVVVPHAPRIVVLYAGENDLNRGVTPEVMGVGLREIRSPPHNRCRHTHRPDLTKPRSAVEVRRDAERIISVPVAQTPTLVYVDPAFDDWKDGTRSRSSLAGRLHRRLKATRLERC